MLGDHGDQEEMPPLQNGSEGSDVTTPLLEWLCEDKICIIDLYEGILPT